MASRSDQSLLDTCTTQSTPSSAHSTPATAHSTPTTPVLVTTVRWAEKRTALKGVVMEDVEKQTSGLSNMKLQSFKVGDVTAFLEGANEDDIHNLIQIWGAATVCRRPLLGDNGVTVKGNLLHAAAKMGAHECLQVLLDANSSKDVLDAPDDEGRTPLLVAVSEAQDEVVKKLLDVGAHINARNKNGQTALHILTCAIAAGKKNEETLDKIANLLLDKKYKIDLEPHDPYEDLTPLGIAASKLPQEDAAPTRNGLIKLCKNLVNAGASLQENGEEGTIEEVLKRKGALPSILMGGELPPAPTRPAASVFLDMILRRNSIQNIREFLLTKSAEDARGAEYVRAIVNDRLGNQTLLFYAIDNSNESLVKTLIEFGAHARALEITHELPIHRAAALGHLPIFNLIIDRMKGGNKSVDLREYTVSVVQKLMESSKRKKGPSRDISHLDCLRRLMEDDVLLNVDQEWMGQTVLHVAAYFKNQEAISKFLHMGSFLGARQTMPGKNQGNILDSLLPATLERAMDGCITHQPANGDDSEPENVLKEDYLLKLNFNFLLPPVTVDKKKEVRSTNEVEVLMDIKRSKRHRHTIKHPLVQCLLYAKWRKALPLYLLNLGLYFFFVVILTGFVYSLNDLRVLEAKSKMSGNSGSSNTTQDLEERISSQQTTMYLFKGFLIPLTMYMLSREVFQILYVWEDYRKNIKNYFDIFLIVVVIIMCCTTFDSDITRHLAAWAMIVAWYEFVLILGRVPPLAIYITMVQHTSKKFIKFIVLYGALILAFTISFNIILQPTNNGQESDFSNFWSTLPKVIVMATGEFEYSDQREQFSRKFLFFTSAILLFLLFLFLIFLVLMNVMIGLAVTETQQVLEDAILYSLTSRLELVYLTESLFLQCPRLRSYIDKIHVMLGSKYWPILSGTEKGSILYAQINNPKKRKRLISGENQEFQSKLDDDTAECLRNHRLRCIEEDQK
ncbi:transient receptor potential channel pyrexia-like [Homarus americanus]|uniref:transient receptor potential channel pyrexia-like n=1 Tax=Homarus americanus TaxID=6706 RepID=UPI001C480F0C|nr:transient receptor potential channel pyrexia-like [Homarus americanus]XP_042227247.1 transient receptor potential channel pyrexia-like [Homarus americanus]XP_042227248.1 transient receptor potential channel pyrexia-like [Homarus americanus]XP_042227249.1 transient receptor potential channel pyrexia-like [Homarus americanus]XP_042227250.1 transient receptor potential channel pyrexia-like [Homarus americanus]XP_042227251.1 transient receptor potential channel pyrexia-like [Homarus americanus]